MAEKVGRLRSLLPGDDDFDDIAEFACPAELENPAGWFAFLRNNGFA